MPDEQRTNPHALHPGSISIRAGVARIVVRPSVLSVQISNNDRRRHDGRDHQAVTEYANGLR